MNIIDWINPYSYAMMLRRWMYRTGLLRSEKIGIPVISIGNLSMGGTGKTPLTEYLAEHCIHTLHKKTAIVLRGYKRRSHGYLLVSDGQTIHADVNSSGDEAQLYATEISEAIVICDEDRLRGARMALALGAEVVLLDDGFQHQRIRRDLNIVLISASEGIPPVLPFGSGRENSTAIRDADIIIQTNAEASAVSAMTWGSKPVVLSSSRMAGIKIYSAEEQIDAATESISGEKILMLSGIANPERFENSISKWSAASVSYRLGDHAEYTTQQLEKILGVARAEQCTMIVTTTKDAVKLLDQYRRMQLGDPTLPRLAVVRSAIEVFRGKEILHAAINALFTK